MNETPAKKVVSDETRNSWILLGVVGMGAYFLWKNRPSPPPTGISGEDIDKALLGCATREEVLTDDLLRLKRKLDRHAAEFDPTELERGTVHELEHTRNRLVAQKIAMDHLRENPGYYQILEEVMPEGA
jgi:hypothetical protein